MKIIKLALTSFKEIVKNFSVCKRKLREAELKIKLLNKQISEYNEIFTKDI
jgi:exonuclease VII small subunit